jgi:hypothetical protein
VLREVKKKLILAKSTLSSGIWWLVLLWPLPIFRSNVVPLPSGKNPNIDRRLFRKSFFPIYIHTYTSTYIHTYVRTYIHIHTRTYTHTYIHTYIHTYVHGSEDGSIHSHKHKSLKCHILPRLANVTSSHVQWCARQQVLNGLLNVMTFLALTYYRRINIL